MQAPPAFHPPALPPVSHLPAQNQNARYLDARVTTASQPELQLMLLEGALRFGQRAQLLWASDAERVQCHALLDRAIDIVEELVRSVANGAEAASKRLEEEYAFVYRELATAKFSHDESRLSASLELLGYQRETWRIVCDNLKSQSLPSTPAPRTRFFAAPPLAAANAPEVGRLSIEA
jgi:flagellar biosynthetic protein FliS